MDFAPIESRPPSTRYRFWRFARRHRVGLALSLITGIACFSVVLGAVRTRAANNERLATVETLSEVLFDHGVTLIMNAEAEKVREVIDRLEKVGADSLTRNLWAVQLLHEHKPHEAIELLEPVVQLHPQDAFLRAMLTDAYDQAGDIHKFISSFAKLKGLELVNSVPSSWYTTVAGIVEPKWGYELADRAVNENPSSEYARLVRARMAANYVQRSFDPSVHKSQEHAAQLIEQALDDIDTLRSCTRMTSEFQFWHCPRICLPRTRDGAWKTIDGGRRFTWQMMWSRIWRHIIHRDGKGTSSRSSIGKLTMAATRYQTYGISITRLQCKTRMITTRTSFLHFAMSLGDRQRMRSRIEWKTIPVRCSANTVLDVGTLCMEKVIKLEARYGD